jgi:hypothetical protein
MHKQGLSTMYHIVLLAVACFVLVLSSRVLAADVSCGDVITSDTVSIGRSIQLKSKRNPVPRLDRGPRARSPSVSGAS